MKLKPVDIGAIVTLVALLLIFPVTNGMLAMGIDMVLEQIALIGAGFIQVPATLLVVYIVWRVSQVIKREDAVKLPKKSAKTTMQKYLEL